MKNKGFLAVWLKLFLLQSEIKMFKNRVNDE